jgi:uncharacterized integral membrane protein
MIKLITFIIIFALFLAFIVLNLGQSSDISFGFRTFENVPVFLSILASFALGMLFSIPLAFSISWKKRKKKPEIKEAKSKPVEIPDKDKVKKEVSPYGID